MRFHGRRVTKVGPEVKHGQLLRVAGRAHNPEKSAKADNGGSASSKAIYLAPMMPVVTTLGYYPDYYEGYPYCYGTALPLSVHLGCLLRDRKVGWHTLQP